MDLDWDDDEFETPRNDKSDDDDDLFEFSSSLRIDDDNDTARPPKESLPPLPVGVEDVLGDRGVLLKRHRPKTGANGKSAATTSLMNGKAAASSSSSGAASCTTPLMSNVEDNVALLKQHRPETSAGSSSSHANGKAATTSSPTDSDAAASSTDAASSTVTLATLLPSKENPFVELHYEGFLKETGEKFDSSVEQGYPMIARLDLPPSGRSTLIRGWEAALPLLCTGERAELTVAARYAYGKEGNAPDIPPDADLRFELEVLDVRATHRRVVKVDHTKEDMSRLEEVRRDREIAQARREEMEAEREAARKAKADRLAALREKLANKNSGKKGKKGAKKKK